MARKEQRRYKAINFDLSTDKLRQHYPSQHYRKAYKDIERFMLQNGFEHRQWSGYRSLERVSDSYIVALIERMNEAHVWLRHCVNKFDVTNIGTMYDMSAQFYGAEAISEQALLSDAEPLTSQLDAARTEAEQRNGERAKPPQATDRDNR